MTQIHPMRPRKRMNVNLDERAVAELRQYVLPLLPGVSLSDILSDFVGMLAEHLVPLARVAAEAPPEVRAAAVESALIEAFGRIALDGLKKAGHTHEAFREDDE